MANKIQIKRGNIINLPILDSGEFGFTIDTEEVYIGTGTSNIKILTQDDIYTNSNVDSHLSGSNGINYSEGVISPTYGTDTNTFCVGNDSRLSDARIPTSHDNTYHSINYEEYLGNPSTDDQILASKSDGSRFWTSQTGISGVNTVEKPYITSPENLITDLTQTPDIVLSAYYALYNKPQKAIQVQISNISGNYSTPTFNSIVEDDINTISVSPALDEDTTYYCRGRYQNIHNEWSNWSEEIQFTTVNFHVNQPSITSPTNNQVNLSLSPTITGSTFSCDGPEDHTKSDWEVATNTTFTSIKFSSYNNTSNKTSISASSLDPNTIYYVRVRYYGEKSEWSEWSNYISFTTNFITKPTNIYPEDEEISVSLTPELESTTISANSGSDTLNQREYTIIKVSDSSVVYNVTI